MLQDGCHWPCSLYAMRFDGGVVEETGFGVSNGDPDYPCAFIANSKSPVLWRKDGMQAVAAMQTPDGEAFYADPRQVLAAVVKKFNDDGLFPILAVELEFYLYDNDGAAAGELYSLDEIDRNADFFALVREAAAVQNIALGAVISECAAGQFEVNLQHQEPLRACLEALLFRRLVRGCARAVGKCATFMAKPYGDASGSGMHIHASVKEKDGGFCFADSAVLRSATAGVLSVLNEAMAFFAPFDNSYRRFVPGSYVPLTACWGEENRNAAVRLPAAAAAAAQRLELRVPGADANPYLVAAAVLAGVHRGMQESSAPPPPMSTARHLPGTWHAALAALSRAKILPHYMDKRFLRLYHQVKNSEWRQATARVSGQEREQYSRII